MGELTGIFVVWIIFYYMYKVFELFVRRKERASIIEKVATSNGRIELPEFTSNKKSMSGLRIGCLFMGIGLGLLVGLIANTMLAHAGYNMDNWHEERLFSVAFGASVMFFGGIGLLVSYPLEKKFLPKDDKK